MPDCVVKIIRCSRPASRFLLTGGLFVLSAVLPLWAAQPPGASRPNFSGTWALDLKESDFGPLPVPTKMVDSIQQSGTALKIQRDLANDEREAHFNLTYQLDGSEVINQVSENKPKSRAHWENEALVVETQTDVEGLPLKIVDRWSLDAGCGCLLVSRHFQSERGDIHLRLIMKRRHDASPDASQGGVKE